MDIFQTVVVKKLIKNISKEVVTDYFTKVRFRICNRRFVKKLDLECEPSIQKFGNHYAKAILGIWIHLSDNGLIAQFSSSGRHRTVKKFVIPTEVN